MPDKDTHVRLLEAILALFTESRALRVRRQLGGETLEGRKPSKFLRHLQHLLGDEVGPNEQDFLRELFLQRMPESTRLLLSACSAFVGLLDLASMSYRMLEQSFLPVHATEKRNESAGGCL